jgi:hypothetical protein
MLNFCDDHPPHLILIGAHQEMCPGSSDLVLVSFDFCRRNRETMVRSRSRTGKQTSATANLSTAGDILIARPNYLRRCL